MYIQNDALENTSLLEELFDPNEVPFHTEFLLAFFFFFFNTRSGMYKHRKSLANTAITIDLVQPKRMYGGLDARLDLEVVP